MSDDLDFLPRVLPAYWRIADRRIDGCAYRNEMTGLAVIISAAKELDGRRWLHLSVSRSNRLPTWDDLKLVKDVFMGRERKVIQVLLPASEYVNIHPFVLHLWACMDGDPLPDFTRGSASL